MFRKPICIFAFLLALLSAPDSLSGHLPSNLNSRMPEPAEQNSEPSIETAILSDLRLRFKDVAVTVIKINLLPGIELNPKARLHFQSENPLGMAHYSSEQSADIILSVQFKLVKKGFIARERIRIGEILSPSMLTREEIDVTSGQNRDLRGLFFQDATLIGNSRIEARNTIIENQPLFTSSVQRVADVRRGEIIPLKIKSGAMEITSSAQADEPGHVGSLLHVTTLKTKKALVGMLKLDGTVEVQL